MNGDERPALDERSETAEERYLWDPTAPPDGKVAELEAALSSLRPLPDRIDLPKRVRPRRARVLTWTGVAVFAAAAAVAALWLQTSETPTLSIAPEAPTALSETPVASDAPSWAWRATAGRPEVGGTPKGEAGSLAAGVWLETDAQTHVRLDVADIGHLDVAPDSKLRLVESSPKEHRLALAKGKIQAEVDAPPRLFVIETKSATAIDLGCAYELSVDEAGDGMLRVTSGSVELEGGKSRVLPVMVPKGAECGIDHAEGPGTPVWARLSAEAKAALAAFDKDRQDVNALDRGLKALTERDSLTWLHLLETAPASRREGILERLAQVVPIPEGVRREDLLSGTKAALAAYRAVISPRWFPGGAGKGAWAPE